MRRRKRACGESNVLAIPFCTPETYFPDHDRSTFASASAGRAELESPPDPKRNRFRGPHRLKPGLQTRFAWSPAFRRWIGRTGLIGIVDRLDRPFGVRSIRAFHGAPQNAVQKIFRTTIGLVQRQAIGRNDVLAEAAVGDLFGFRRYFIERKSVRHTVEGGEIGLGRKALEHGRGAGVQLVHGRQPENLLDGANEADLVVAGADGALAAGIGTGDIAGSAVTADMIP